LPHSIPVSQLLDEGCDVQSPGGSANDKNDLTLLPARRWRAGDGLDQV